MPRILVVAFGGALGAMARYWLSGWIARWTSPSPFPWGTLGVNVIGSFALGFLIALGAEGRILLSPTTRALWGLGFLGAFTTFSTFSFETMEAFRLGDPKIALANIGFSLLLGLAACFLGLTLGGR